MRHLICSTALLVMLAGCGGQKPEDYVALKAPAGPAQLLYAPVGTRILLITSVNGTPGETNLTVQKADGIFGNFSDGQGRPRAYLPGCWGCSGGMEINPQDYAALWPLVTGNTVRFNRRSATGQQAEVTIRVAGREDVETPLGQFETFVLEGRVENLSGPRYSAQMRSWWAPGLGWVIKSSGGDSRGNTVESQIADFSRP